MKQIILALSVAMTAACSTQSTQQSAQPAALTYPPALRGDQADVYHGLRVADPYRWLESESAPQTRRFIEAENALSQPYLEAIPALKQIKKRMTQLWNYERYDTPVKRGGRYFYLRNDGLQNQSVLFIADSLTAEPRVLLDPNTLSKDATVALGEFVPSPDGKLLAYSLSDGGTDWRTWHIRDVATGRDLPDVLRFIKFVSVAWTADSRSVYYARYPLRPDGTGDDSKQREICRHVLGTPVASDPLIYRIADHPSRSPFVQTSDDGRYLVISIYEGSVGSQQTGIYYIKLAGDGSPAGGVVRLFDTFDAAYEFVAEVDDVFYVHTTKDAPNARVIAARAVPGGADSWREIVPESDHALVSASVVGHKVITQYLQDVRSVVRVHELSGKLLYDVKLPGLGQAGGFQGDAEDQETFFSYTDFLTPASISRLDVTTGAVSTFRAPRIDVDLSRYVTEQVFYRSKDGTRVPMFITRKRDFVKNGQAPTILYGYGGFSIPQLPAFSVPALVWVEMGGVYAVANLRGGSEYGEEWHSAGKKLLKQNVFDDFIAGAEYLIAQKYTSTPRLAIHGRSNGGLLVAATIAQRPDLFGAALPGVGVLDMLRYHTASENARQWSSDFGLSENEEEFRALLAYSPLHNLHKGTCYPPTLITTADRDDRVVPWHSYKFTAELQYAQSCANAILLSVETRAGHGAGKPVWMQIEEYADQWAFVLKSFGM